jgi:hypothetical protein
MKFPKILVNLIPQPLLQSGEGAKTRILHIESPLSKLERGFRGEVDFIVSEVKFMRHNQYL